MLDRLVSGFGAEQEMYRSHEGATAPAPTMHLDDAVVGRLQNNTDGKHKVRVTPTTRKAVGQETFVRYSHQEQHAMKHFRFLEDMSTGTISRAASAEDRRLRERARASTPGRMSTEKATGSDSAASLASIKETKVEAAAKTSTAVVAGAEKKKMETAAAAKTPTKGKGAAEPAASGKSSSSPSCVTRASKVGSRKEKPSKAVSKASTASGKKDS